MIVRFNGTVCQVLFSKYIHGDNIAIQLVDRGEPVATATLNPEMKLEHDEVVIKDYSENAGMYAALLEAGIIQEAHKAYQAGFVTCPVCRLIYVPFQEPVIHDVNWVVVTEEFKTFEFSTVDDLVLEDGESFDLFRLFLWNNERVDIMIANTNDYDVHEDVTSYFDVEKVIERCLAAEKTIENVTDDYEKYYAKVEY